MTTEESQEVAEARVEAVRQENDHQRDELFARVAQLEQWLTVEHDEASKFAIERNKWRTKAEAAEERVAELETLLEAL